MTTRISGAYKEIFKYRQIQIVLQQFRVCYSDVALVGMISGLSLLQILGTHVAVGIVSSRTGTHVNLLISMMCVWYVVHCPIIVVVIFGMYGKVYQKSKTFINVARKRSFLMRCTLFKRIVRSLPILRVYFGESNFVEPCTGLNAETFVIQQIVNMLVMTV